MESKDDDSSRSSGPDPAIIEALGASGKPEAAIARTGWGLPGARAALVGGLLAALSTVLMPFHLGGSGGILGGMGFAAAGFALAGASMALGANSELPQRARHLRYWALLGAMGFLISGAGLVADLLDWPILLSEILAVSAVAAWWLVVGGYLAFRPQPASSAGSVLVGGRALGAFSLICASAALAALALQVVWQAPDGAVPARLSYLMWGPWGLWLATRLARHPVPV